MEMTISQLNIATLLGISKIFNIKKMNKKVII
jgi:hypothetical protein